MKTQRRRYLLAGLWAIIALSLVGAPLASPQTAFAAGNYRSYADSAATQLMSWYNSNSGLWSTTNWWNSANALTAMIDYMERTGSQTYRGIIATTYDKNSGNNFRNDWFDDTMWWGIAWMRAYDLTGDVRYRTMAASTADYAYANAWTTQCGGGLWNNQAHVHKDAVTNGLFLKLTAGLHNRISGDTKYLQWADMQWSWFQASGMWRSDKLITNAVAPNCAIEEQDDILSYNQGVYIGGLIEYRWARNDPARLADAQAIANASIATPFLNTSGGILREVELPPSDEAVFINDAATFKGVFMRNLGELYDETNSSSYRTYIMRQADSLWANDRNGNQFGYRWQGPFDSANAARQQSALDAFNVAIAFSTSNPTWTTVQDTASGYTWYGWSQYSDSGATDGSMHGADGSQWGFEYSFSGTGVQVYGWKGSEGGTVEVWIDDVSQGTVNMSATSDSYNQLLYSKTGLAAGQTHTIEFGSRSSASTWNAIDYLRILQ